MGHCFDADGNDPAAEEAFCQVLAFLDKHVRKNAT